MFDQIYSFDRDALIKSIPRPSVKMSEKEEKARRAHSSNAPIWRAPIWACRFEVHGDQVIGLADKIERVDIAA